MTETAKAVIDRLQGEAGYATGGEVDKLVFSGLDVHTMLNEIEQAIDTGENKTEKLQEQLNTAKYFFKNILDVDPNLNKGHVSHLENCVRVMKNSAEKALAAIGGKNESLDN